MTTWFEVMTIMKSSSSIAKILTFLLTLTLALGTCGLTGCIDYGTPIITIIVHNQTDETLQIFLDGEVFVGEAVPGGEMQFKTVGVSGDYIITAKDIEGNRVYDTGFTYVGRSKRTYHVYFPPEID